MQRNTHPMLWKQEGPCGTSGLSPGGRDMQAHSSAVAADSKLESSTATGFPILPVWGIAACWSCCLCLLWCVQSRYALNPWSLCMSLFFSELTQALGGSRFHQGHYFVRSVLPQQLQLLGLPPCRCWWAGLQGWFLGLAGAAHPHSTLVTDNI